MRCFIAIDLPEAIKESIGNLIKELRQAPEDVKWVAPENMHLTLKFLGEVEEKRIGEIKRRLALLCERHRTFSLSLRGTGAFPGLKYPRVLWVGIDAPEELTHIFQDIEASLSEMGFEKETRRFSPHLTLGRVRDARTIDLTIKGLSTFKESFFGTIEVHDIVLMQSTLKPTGPEYSKLHVFTIGSGK